MRMWGGGVAPAALCLMLAGCGGGGDSGGSVTVPSPTPTLNVTLSATSQALTITEDDSGATLGFDATVQGTGSDPVLADIGYDRGQLVLVDPVVKKPNGGYQVRLRPASTLAPGSYNGSVTFRLCREAACSTVYGGSTQVFTYKLTVGLADWTTFQRNAAHTGFVNTTLNPASFAKAWEWTSEGSTGVSTIASFNGLAYAVTRDQDGTSSVRALIAATGQPRWSYNLGRISDVSAPAIGNRKVFVTTLVSSSENNAIVPIDAETGQFVGPNAPFASQWSSFLAPTPYGEGLYMSAGYYGNVVYGYDYSALTYWYHEASGYIWDGQTPAVDADSVYYYSGTAIEVIDRATGALKQHLLDPFFQNSGYDYHGAPILGSNANVLAYSGHRGDGSPSVLVNWSKTTGAYAWRSADSYSTTPAVGGGIVYLARNNPGRLDALNESSGAPQWSWTPPAGERFVGNTVATRNLVFVSTDKAVYAIPTEGNHAPVWSGPTGGDMAITGDGMLIVRKTPETYSNPTTLVAYRLR
ncbi:hypothetical protein ACBY01_12440 [Sphingomonas sp. ac-8]|uniref:hypothetical protein n=1 Tax=Sphingomonas sp. ac-8 TaxID=3242977 RepID=UPI003A806B8F